MDENEANSIIRIAGVLGLIAVVLSLTSATIRLPGRSGGLLSGITPLIGVEFAHSKAELQEILGPVGSANRSVLANRSIVPGYDFASVWMLFLYVLYTLKWMLRIEGRWLRYLTLFMIILTLGFHREVINGTVEAANATVVTDELFNRFHTASALKWLLLFVTTAFCAPLFWRAPWVLRFAGELMGVAPIAGPLAMLYDDRFVAPIILIMFVLLFGISTLLVFRPHLLSEVAAAGKENVNNSERRREETMRDKKRQI